jgi:hypothetical protein
MAFLGKLEQHAEVVDDLVEETGIDPPLGLLVDRREIPPAGDSTLWHHHGAPERTIQRSALKTARWE